MRRASEICLALAGIVGLLVSCADNLMGDFVTEGEESRGSLMSLDLRNGAVAYTYSGATYEGSINEVLQPGVVSKIHVGDPLLCRPRYRFGSLIPSWKEPAGHSCRPAET